METTGTTLSEYQAYQAAAPRRARKPLTVAQVEARAAIAKAEGHAE